MTSSDACDVRLSELIESLPLGKSSVFELLKVLGIATTKRYGEVAGGSRGRIAWLSAADAKQVIYAAHRVSRGEVRIADLRVPSIGSSEGGYVLGIDLSSTSLPDAIALMVEAWYDAQELQP